MRITKIKAEVNGLNIDVVYTIDVIDERDPTQIEKIQGMVDGKQFDVELILTSLFGQWGNENIKFDYASQDDLGTWSSNVASSLFDVIADLAHVIESINFDNDYRWIEDAERAAGWDPNP